MSRSDDPLAKLKHSYQTLGVPPTASAPAIKHAYRKLVKRWHPDLYPSGTHAHAEATQMSERINAAYAAIENAPLRYLSEPRVTAEPRSPAPPTAGILLNAIEQVRMDEQTFLTIARIEYAVRFVCGAVFGIFVCLLIAFYALAGVHSELEPLIPVALGITIACGYLSARLGDKFWYLLLRRWWLEP
jgi:DnaJ domain